MKNSILVIFAFTATFLITSCSAYKASQTPDDVYFSPGKEMLTRSQDQYQEYISSNDDRYLRLKAQNYTLWSPLDDYSYWYDSRYAFNMNYDYLYSPYYSYFYNPLYTPIWGGFYNPEFITAGYKNPVFSTINYSSGSNISAYNNRSYNTTNNREGYSYYVPPTNGSYSGRNGYNNYNSRGDNSYYRNTYYNNAGTQNWSNPVRVSQGGYSNTSSSAGGLSGGFSSKGTSSGGGRGSRN